MTIPPLLLLLLTLLPATLATLTPDRPLALTTSTAYLIQRTCVQECIWNNGYRDLLVALTCSYPGLDGCLCRTDLLPSATSFLSSCAASGCTGNTVDVSLAVSLWTQYCSGDDAKLFTYAPLVSIISAAEFKAQRGCVQSCIWNNGYRDLNIAMKCGYHWYDACLCRTDLDTVATSFLSSCVNSACSGNANDIAAAISLRTAYCAGEMQTAATGTEVLGGGNGKATPGGLPTSTSTSTSTSNANNSSTSGTLSSLSVIIGSVIAGVVGIAILAGIIVMCRRRRNQPSVGPGTHLNGVQVHYSGWTPMPGSYAPYKQISTPEPSMHNMVLLSPAPSPPVQAPPMPTPVAPSPYPEGREDGDTLGPLPGPGASHRVGRPSVGVRRTASILTQGSCGSNPGDVGAGSYR